MTSNFNEPESSREMMSGPDEYEGRLIAGPFKGANLREIERALAEFDIRSHHEGKRAKWTRLPGGGFELRAEGPGIRGYFVDSDGLESPQTDLDNVIMRVVAMETDFHIRGLHQVSPDKMIAVSLKARHDGHSVVWTGSRSLIGDDATPQVTAVGRSIPGV